MRDWESGESPLDRTTSKLITRPLSYGRRRFEVRRYRDVVPDAIEWSCGEGAANVTVLAVDSRVAARIRLTRFLRKHVPNAPSRARDVAKAIDSVAMGGTLRLAGLQDDEARSLCAGLEMLGAKTTTEDEGGDRRQAINETSVTEEREWTSGVGPASLTLVAIDPGTARIRLIKFLRKNVRNASGSLRDVKKIVDSVADGGTVKMTGLGHDEARSLRDALKVLGAEATIDFGVGIQRQAIPERVRHEVWRRDQGRCVECGSRERLEYDHIVPVSRGGSNTARNIELRCEPCNRRKAAKI